MKNNTGYTIFKKLYLQVRVSVLAKVFAICGISSISIGEYLGIGISRNFGISAALINYISTHVFLPNCERLLNVVGIDSLYLISYFHLILSASSVTIC